MKPETRKFLKNNGLAIITFVSLLLKSCFVLITINTGQKAGKYHDLLEGYKYMRSLQFLILPIVLFLSFAYLFQGKGHIMYLLILNTFMSTLFIIDVWYYRGFSTPVSVLMYNQTANLDNTSGSIMDIIRGQDLLIYLDILLAIIGIIVVKLFTNFQIITLEKRNITCFIVAAIISISIIPVEIYVFDAKPLKRFFRLRWNPRQTINSLSPIGYHMFDAYQFWAESSYTVPAKKRRKIDQWYKENNENLPGNKYKGLLKGKNLIIIQVESLESFVINNKAYNQFITPNINKLLSNSIYFPNYFELVGGGTSSDSDFMTNVSLYPMTNNSVFFTKPRNTYLMTLPKLLEKRGYDTIAIHPDKKYFWNWEPSLRNIGFDGCIDASYFKITERIGLGISDKCYLNQVKPIIANENSPFYSFMITLTSHNPYDLPQKDKKLKFPSKLDNNCMGKYLQCINYTDTQLGDFMNYLDRKGILKNSIVVMYGDHTSIHKYHAEEVKKLKWFPLARINNDKRVPLIIYSKGLKPAEVKTYCSQVDLLPTICYLMGIEDKSIKEYAIGKNALNTRRNYTVRLDGTMEGIYTKKQKRHAVEGIENSQIIIRSNYFRKQKINGSN